ncbi:GDSL-type esterase/lipase family protein [Ruicaihuangia caeni]|uniref:GDSL-type esterase/lipase family protein n=1 Tax=Ruicaihuangia caeni TaxID=3042517 RepID=UPI00338DE2AA
MGATDRGAGRRVAFLGDGLVADGRWQEWVPDYDVSNLGIPDAKVEQVLEALDRVVDDQPDAVVLLAGPTDFDRRGSTVEHVVRTLESILVEVRRRLPGVRLLLISVVPGDERSAERRREANRHLWQFAATVRAQYLDLWPALSDKSGALPAEYRGQGGGLSAAGYDAWVAELRPALERLWDGPPMSRPISIVEL